MTLISFISSGGATGRYLKMRTRASLGFAAIRQMKHMDFAKHTFKIAPSWRNLILRSAIAFSSQTACRGSDGKSAVPRN